MIRYPAICRAALCMAALVLGGCVHASKAEFMHHYTLGSVASSGQAATPRGSKVLRVARIAAPPWLQDTAMYYRLDYRHDRRIAAYAHSDWVAPPATLLEPIVQRTLAAAARWRAVLDPRSPGIADVSLRLRLDDFIQAFARQDDSAGVIDVTATVIDNHDDRVIAQRHFHIEAAAPSADAEGGVIALETASRRFASELQRWLDTAANAGASKTLAD